jgi:hypothetical protein
MEPCGATAIGGCCAATGIKGSAKMGRPRLNEAAAKNLNFLCTYNTPVAAKIRMVWSPSIFIFSFGVDIATKPGWILP